MSSKLGKQPSGGQVEQLIGQLRTATQIDSLASPATAGQMLSLESISVHERQNLESTFSQLSAALESIGNNTLNIKYNNAQLEAGVIAGMLAGSPEKFLQRGTQAVATEGQVLVGMPNMGNTLGERSYALEAYDERANKNAAIFSVAWNLQAALQMEFGETLFPTLTLPADNVGLGVEVPLIAVYSGAEHKVTGSFESFRQKNLLRAAADHTVLHKEATRITPVYRAQAADMFVDQALVAAAPVVLDEETILTAPLAFGKKISLLGISQTESLLALGLMNQTDSIDPAASMSTAYFKFGADILRFNTLNLPSANFVYTPQQLNRLMTMNFTTTSIVLNKNSKAFNGAALVDLAAIVTNDLTVRLELHISGSINLQTSETTVFANGATIHSVTDATGATLAPTHALVIALKAEIDAGIALGWEPLAYRSNQNRRQRGQLLDTLKYTQLYNVPLRAPIAIHRPVNSDGTQDAADVHALVVATRFWTANEAVTALLQADTMLGEYAGAMDLTGEGPEVLGVGRYFVRPQYLHDTLVVSDSTDSRSSHERAADIQAVLVSRIRDMAYNLYRNSEYKPASDALSGGQAGAPVVIIATDPVLARYINVEGELRTLGGGFDFRIVDTIDKRMKGKIFVTFGVFDENRNVAVNPLNFGNMIWAPELVLTINQSRDNTISRETVVQPRYLFIVNCPILGRIDVSGIPDALGKITVNMNQVP